MLVSLLRRLLSERKPDGVPAGHCTPSASPECLQALNEGNLEFAIQCFRDHLARHPDDADAHNNLGVAFQRSGNSAAALACYETAIRIAPKHADAWYNAALIHHVRDEFDLAQEHYEGALRTDPAHAEANRESSMLRLARGEFSRETWSRFRHRRRCPGFEATVNACPAPLWNGEPLANATMLVYGEQGLGDEILFASCYPDLITQAGRCVIETEPRLERLFQRSFPGATVIGRQRREELGQEYPSVAWQAPCGDLACFLRSSAEAFPRDGAYLRADPAAVERWRRALNDLGAGLKIGISWRGGTARSNQAGRSIDLAEWQPVLDIPGTRFVNLQYGRCDAELADVRERLGATIRHFPEAIADYDETAALVCALDLVITVTTSVAHLAGALGQQVWILANAAPRWCYMESGGTTPWYRSARIFRQPRMLAWREVMEQVRGALARGEHAPGYIAGGGA